MAKQLTVKQAKFVKAVAEGKPKYKAAMEAYDVTSVDSANQIAKENLQKTSIKEALHAELARQGITLEAVVKPIADGLKATKTTIVRDKAATPEESENSAFAQEEADHAIRLKSSAMAQKLMGLESANDGSVTNNFVQIINQKAEKYADD